jgi:hypothetical protein
MEALLPLLTKFGASSPLGLLAVIAIIACYKLWKDNHRLVTKIIELSASSTQAEMDTIKALEGVHVWYTEWPRIQSLLGKVESQSRNVEALLLSVKAAHLLQMSEAAASTVVDFESPTVLRTEADTEVDRVLTQEKQDESPTEEFPAVRAHREQTLAEEESGERQRKETPVYNKIRRKTGEFPR